MFSIVNYKIQSALHLLKNLYLNSVKNFEVQAFS